MKIVVGTDKENAGFLGLGLGRSWNENRGLTVAAAVAAVAVAAVVVITESIIQLEKKMGVVKGLCWTTEGVKDISTKSDWDLLGI